MTKTIKQLSYICCYEGATSRYYSVAEKTYRMVQLFPQNLRAQALCTCLTALGVLDDWAYEPVPDHIAIPLLNALEATEARDLLEGDEGDITPLDIDLAYPSGSPEIWERRLSNMIRDLLHDH